MFIRNALNPSPRHWLDVMRGAAQEVPHDPAFSFLGSELSGDTCLTYSQLDEAARAVAAALQQAGHSGGRALLLYPPGADYICALMGCMYAGVTAVPVYAPRANASFERIELIVKSARATVLLSTRNSFNAVRQSAQHAALAQVSWLATDALDVGLASLWREPQLGADTLALLQFTSGSTGRPKGVQLLHRHLLANSHCIQRAMGSTRESVGVIWLPPYHDMGLIGGLLQPFYVRFPVHLMSPSAFLQRPIRWLELISKARGTISSAPNFAYALCVRRVKPEQLERLDLRSWKVAANGAEPIRAETLQRFAQTFAPCGFSERAFFPCYGMAEATLYVSGARLGQGMRTLNASRAALAKNQLRASSWLEDGIELVSSGGVDPDTHVEIVDPHTGARCAPGDVGEIWIQGPGVAAGYFDSQRGAPHHGMENTHSPTDTFTAQLPDREGCWLRSGDLGAFMEGELYITGRLKDLIIIGGQNHYPHDIEATVMAVRGELRPHHAAAFALEGVHGEHLALVVELDRKRADPGMEQLGASIRHAISTQHQLQLEHLIFVARGAISRTSSGKTQRHLTRARWLDGDLQALEPDAVQEVLA